MRTAMLVFSLCLVPVSAFSQNRTSTELPVFDKKFWTVTGTLVGSSIIMTELAVHEDKKNRPERRLKIYTAAGISDFLVFAMSANSKSDGRKWWWIPPIAVSAVKSGFAIKYSKSF